MDYARIGTEARMARKNQDVVLEGVLWITRGLGQKPEWRVKIKMWCWRGSMDYARIGTEARMARKNQDVELEGGLWITRGLKLRRKWRVINLRDEGRSRKILPPEPSGCL